MSEVITRNQAAEARYLAKYKKIDPDEIARQLVVPPEYVTAAINGTVHPPLEDLVPVNPPGIVRTGRISFADRLEISRLLCCGASIMHLCERYGVNPRAISNIKQSYTMARGRRRRGTGMNLNKAAEIRYSYDCGLSYQKLQAKYNIDYNLAWRVITYLSWKPLHEDTCTRDGLRVDSQAGRITALYLHGADIPYIAAREDLEPSTVENIVQANTTYGER